MAFQLPPNISSKKIRLPNCWAYVFRHTELGEIGRILLSETSNGKTIATAEITGFPEDPMTAKRRAVFEPIGKDLIDAFGKAMGNLGSSVSNPRKLPPPGPTYKKGIASKMFQCEKCGVNVGLLVFSEGNEIDFLEDAARMMYQEIKRHNVPTWIVGEISGEGNPMKNRAKILKVHPKRETIFEASPEEFDPIIDSLEQGHCK